MEAEDAGDPGHTAEGREQRHGQLCAGHQPDGHGHSDAEQHLQCTGDDERRTPANAADAAAGDRGDRRDDGEHTGHGNDRDAGNRSDRNRGIA